MNTHSGWVCVIFGAAIFYEALFSNAATTSPATSPATQAAASGPASQPADANSDSPENRIRRLAAPICLDGMVAIRKDLAKLAKDFPDLAKLGEAEIIDGTWYQGQDGSLFYRLEFKKNVKKVEIPDQVLVAVKEIDVVDKGGVLLKVSVADSYFRTPASERYDLKIQTGQEWRCIFYLETNPENPKLKAAIAKVMEKQAKLLAEKLEPVRKLQAAQVK